MSRVPSPFERVWRDRSKLVAVALLALVSLAAAGISATAAERLQSVLDANWRGAYDILVTADGNLSAVDGLLPPNSLSSGAFLTLDDVAAIRAIDGVDVAAPIGQVVVAGLSPGGVQVSIPKGAAGAGTVPQSYRVTMTYRTNDGLGERLVSYKEYNVVVDERVRQPRQTGPVKNCAFNDLKIAESAYPEPWAHFCGGTAIPAPTVSYGSNDGWSGTDDSDGGSLLFNLGNSPVPLTRITLVDPVAERELLGTAGSFLKPLVQLDPNADLRVDSMTKWADESDTKFASDFLKQEQKREAAQIGASGVALDELKQLYADNGVDFSVLSGSSQVFVPLIVSETGSAPLSVRVDVEGFGGVNDGGTQGFGYQLPTGLLNGAAGTPIGSSVADVSDVLNPFAPAEERVPWPGTPKSIPSDARNFYSTLIYDSAAVVGATVQRMPDRGDGPTVRLSPSGYVRSIKDVSSDAGPFDLTASASKPGAEAAHSDVTSLTQPGAGEIGVPVGTFSVNELKSLQSPLNYVPLGAYQLVGSTLIAGSSSRATRDVELQPGVTGLGLVNPRTVAIASIRSAASWGQTKPVSAVRVRVAGVDGFTAGAVEKITGVARAIEKLGFTATVVAGSSPTDTTVQVDGYAFGVTSPDQKQEVGILGSVTQRWSELGAAARANLAVSNTSFAILAVALGAAALLLAAVQLAGVPGRRAQASVMRTIGWRRRRIVRWMAAEELVALAIVAIAGVIALLLASSRSAVTIAVGGSVAALVVTSTLAVLLSARPLASGIRPLRRGKRRHRMQEVRAWATTTWRLALRQVAVHRLNAAVQILATVVVAVAASTVTVTIIDGRAAAGASALGVFAVDQAFVAQLGLGAMALVAGIVLAVIARRIDLVGRHQQWTTMRAMGWSAGQVRAVQVIEGMLVGIPAVAIAGALAWWYLHEVARGLIAVALPIGLGAAGVLTVILVLTSWREKK